MKKCYVVKEILIFIFSGLWWVSKTMHANCYIVKKTSSIFTIFTKIMVCTARRKAKTTRTEALRWSAGLASSHSTPKTIRCQMSLQRFDPSPDSILSIANNLSTCSAKEREKTWFEATFPFEIKGWPQARDPEDWDKSPREKGSHEAPTWEATWTGMSR